MELYRQAEQLIVADNVVIPIYQDTDYELIKPRVHGLRLSPLGILGLESVWIGS
jgi:peptide/nickel transport system substrate-binding protein/oligopeptide transport system substrate-binding protein